MKIKKIGEIKTDKELHDNNFNIEEQHQLKQEEFKDIKKDTISEEISIPGSESAKKNKYYITGGILLILIAAVLYYVLIYQKSVNTQDKENELLGSNDKQKTENGISSDDLKKKELELKQKELELKEKELNKQNFQEPNLNTPDGVVAKFIQSLGKQDWSAAFGLMSEKRRGSYSTFSSTKGYGGITNTKIYSCSYTGETNGKKEVMVDYESIDPSNKSGRFKQYYYLISFNDSYLITDIKNINIEWF
jgi:hypothetical protein